MTTYACLKDLSVFCVNCLGGRKKGYKQDVQLGGYCSSTGKGRRLVALGYWWWICNIVDTLKIYFVGNIDSFCSQFEVERGKRREESRMIARSFTLGREYGIKIYWDIVRKKQDEVPFWPHQVWDISKMAKAKPTLAYGYSGWALPSESRFQGTD